MDINHRYYGDISAGRSDYWDKMAAPLFRVKMIRSLLKSLSFTSLVDMGCGNGRLLVEIHKVFPNIDLCGIDLSKKQIETNKEIIPEFQWKQFDIEKSGSIPRELEKTFDVAVSSEVIEHLDRPEALLRTARQITNDGGILILTTQSGPVRETERRVGHKRHFSSGELVSLLLQSGWKPRRVWNMGFPFHDLSKWAANLKPDSAIHVFGNERYGILPTLTCRLLRFLFLFNSPRSGAQLFAVAERE